MTSAEMFSPVFTQTTPESAMLNTKCRPFSFATWSMIGLSGSGTRSAARWSAPAAPTALPAARTGARAPSCRSPSPSGRAPSRSAPCRPGAACLRAASSAFCLPSSSAVFFLVELLDLRGRRLAFDRVRGDVLEVDVARSSRPPGTASAAARGGCAAGGGAGGWRGRLLRGRRRPSASVRPAGLRPASARRPVRR